MITTLKYFDVFDTNKNEVVASYALKLNGYDYELHTKTEIIMSGIEAERHYPELLSNQRMLCGMIPNLEIVEH